MAQFGYPASDITVGSVWILPVLTRGSGAATGTTIAIPTHESGNLIVIAARRAGSTTAPSLPAGWTNINTASATTNVISGRMGYKVAASSSETSGTWTNATDLLVWVLRFPAASPVGGAIAANSQITTYTAGAATLTLAVTDGSSIELSAIYGSTAGGNISAVTANGWATIQGAGSPFAACEKQLATANTTGADGACTNDYCSQSVEIKSVASSYFLALDEVTEDDTDFVAATANTNALEVKLGAVTDPVSSTGHIVHHSVRSFNGGGAGESMKVELIQGTTVIAGSGTISLSRTAFTAGSFTLTGAQANSITDYTDLRLRLTGVTLGAGEFAACSWCNLEVPDAPAAGGVPYDLPHSPLQQSFMAA